MKALLRILLLNFCALLWHEAGGYAGHSRANAMPVASSACTHSTGGVCPPLLLGRGFTCHEHLPWFNIINMNARLYDPIVGRFLSPDPYVQAPDMLQNYNRYSYCLNNPLMYVDESGEWFGIDDLIGFVVGGVVNVVVNALQGNINSFWDGLAAFGAGGAAGTLALYGPAGWAAGGAIVGATNAWLGGATSASDIAISAGVGAIAGVAGGAVGSAAVSAANPLLNSISSPVLRGAAGGVIGGAAGGYAGGFTAGLIMTGDIEAANNAGLSGMWLGASIGGVVGAGTGYKYAVDNNLNPWNGRSNYVEAPQQTPSPKVQEVLNTLNEIKADGGTISPNNLNPQYQQELNITIEYKGVKLDLRIETHGLSPRLGGNYVTPIRHLNLDLTPRPIPPLPNNGHIKLPPLR